MLSTRQNPLQLVRLVTSQMIWANGLVVLHADRLAELVTNNVLKPSKFSLTVASGDVTTKVTQNRLASER